MNITRLLADESGESHFEDMAIQTSLVDFAPPAPKASISTPNEVKRQLFLILPKGWYGDMHPSPAHQVMTVIAGALEVTASDGAKRTFRPGDTALVEDTEGRGHATKNIGEDETVVNVAQW